MCVCVCVCVCVQCRAIFLSEQELLDHSRVCKAKRVSDSASFSSESADIEVLSEEVEGSDSDSVLEEGEEEEEEEELAAIEMARPPSTTSSRQKKPRPPGAATPPAAKAATKRKRTRGRRRSGTKTAANITEAVRSSSSGEVGSALNAKQKRRGNSQSVGSNDRNASTSPSKRRESGSTTMQPTQEVAEYNFDTYNNYEDEDFSNSDEDDLEETIMPHEMTRLLSLNEQDMYENEEGESDKEEDDKDKGGDLFNLGSHFHKGKQPNGEPLAIIEKSSDADQKESSGSNSDKLKRKKRPTKDPPKENTPPPPKTATQRVQVEPVGVFWDIENCPVPLDKCAFSLANKIRREFFEGKREAEFMCVCDITKERKEVTNSLHNAQARANF